MADTDTRFLNDADLGARLRGLLLHEPATDLWGEISSNLPSSVASATRHRRRHPFVAVALAAGLAITALLPWSKHDATLPIPIEAPALSAHASADLDWLLARSGQLEAWLGDLPTAPSGNGRDLMATVEVEDLIALVDLQLEASRDTSEALPLWRQRVALLETLSVLRSAPYGVADAVATPADNGLDLHRL